MGQKIVNVLLLADCGGSSTKRFSIFISVLQSTNKNYVQHHFNVKHHCFHHLGWEFICRLVNLESAVRLWPHNQSWVPQT